MTIIDLDLSNEDYFKYAIIYSLHYFDGLQHIEKQFENNYNFKHSTPREFEIDNPNISLTVFNEDEEIIYSSNNVSRNKVNIIKMNDGKYAPIRPIKDHFIE